MPGCAAAKQRIEILTRLLESFVTSRLSLREILEKLLRVAIDFTYTGGWFEFARSVRRCEFRTPSFYRVVPFGARYT